MQFLNYEEKSIYFFLNNLNFIIYYLKYIFFYITYIIKKKLYKNKIKREININIFK